VDLAEQIRLEHAAKRLRGRVLEVPVEDHAGVVDPHVDPAKPLDRAARERLNRGLLAHVGGDGDRLGSPGGAVGTDLRKRARTARGENQAGTSRGHRLRRGLTDAARGAGDDNDGI
jgi:hypothetical protein